MAIESMVGLDGILFVVRGLEVPSAHRRQYKRQKNVRVPTLGRIIDSLALKWSIELVDTSVINATRGTTASNLSDANSDRYRTHLKTLTSSMGTNAARHATCTALIGAHGNPRIRS